MAMPVASMHEENGPIFWKYEVRPAGQPAVMKPKSETRAVQRTPD